MAELTKEQIRFMIMELQNQMQPTPEQIAEEQAQIQAREEAILAEMNSKGYSGEGTVADFKLLMNKPEWFGATWEAQAESFASDPNAKAIFRDYYERYGRTIA